MSKTYKLWIEIEEYDSETDQHRNVTDDGEAEPVPMGVFDSLDDAIEAAESYDMFQGHLQDVTGADLEHPPNDPHPFRKPVRDLLKRLIDAEFRLLWVDDGEDTFFNVNFETAADHILSVDESYLGIRKRGSIPFWLFIVLGNGKEELVSDYSWSDCPEHKELEAVLDAFYEHWQPAQAPTRAAARRHPGGGNPHHVID